jgi:hypothetical protein
MSEPEDLSPEERKFLEEAEEIGRQVAAMSDEEVAAYIKEHGLEELVKPERVEALIKEAMITVRAGKGK